MTNHERIKAREVARVELGLKPMLRNRYKRLLKRPLTPSET